MTRHYYLTHPQVMIDPNVPVPEWGLSQIGRDRLAVLLQSKLLRGVQRIISSGERKAIETGGIIAKALGLEIEILEASHENDRSATGFLPPPEFEAVADEFFAKPAESVRGWERAIDAQARIVSAVEQALAGAPGKCTLFAGHGGVGTLLMCQVGGYPIQRMRDQPPGGGNYFSFGWQPAALMHGWRACDQNS